MNQDNGNTNQLAEGRKLGPYELLKRVGSGGMGVVFLARDTEHNSLVALKTLHKLDPVALLKLKNEFRGVSNVVHPNLVVLHELMQKDDIWFLTMEYVEGETLRELFKRAEATGPSALRANLATTKGQETPSLLASTETVTVVGAPTPLPEAKSPAAPFAITATEAPKRPSLTQQETVTSVHENNGTPPPGSGENPPTTGPGVAALPAPRPLLNTEQLRSLLGDLSLAICALHEAGKLHCDIKPSNVMLTPDRRVVLLDFGLVLERTQSHEWAHEFAGTPAYISPEQLAGNPATEASDWYSLGVMLYEALCGYQPFPSGKQVQDKMRREAPPIPDSSHIPEDLRQLCMQLLSRNPADRPKGSEVVKRLRGLEEPAPAIQQSALEARTLAGRQEHLSALLHAYQKSRQGRAVTVHVYGRSGMGKTALLRSFLKQVRRQEQAIVLSGRCYERESVPYKAFDNLIDSLTRYLWTFSTQHLRELLPAHTAELARIFPVLRQIPAIAQAPVDSTSARDQGEQRSRAFRALKELLGALARRVPLVLHIDDLQWGDPDSFALLNELLAPYQAPPLLMICSFRSEGVELTELLAEHRRIRLVLGERVDIREVEVGPLTESEATRLAASLLGCEPTDAQALTIGRESQGNPFFVEELVRYAASATSAGRELPSTSLSLEGLILSRVGQLPERARTLLEVVAIAGRRIAQGVATRAATVENNVVALWTLLRTKSMVQTWGARDTDEVECYHDRIRESVHAQLSPEALKAHHQRLAEVFEASGATEPEELARYYLNAGVREKAGHYLTLAGDRAAEALAFARAAELYGYASECMPEERMLKVKRADALANAGRGAEAAPLYMESSRSAPPEESFVLRRRAAEQLLASGYLGDGLNILRPLLREQGLSYPSTPKSALLGLIGRSIQLSLRGTRFRERPEAQVAPELLKTIDLAWAAGKGVGAVDQLHGAYFSMRSTLLALKSGEPHRIARGLSYAGLLTMARGRPADFKRGWQLMDEAEQLAKRIKDSYVLGFGRVNAGTAYMMTTEWGKGVKVLEEGLPLLEERCTGVHWETSTGRAVYACLLWNLGRIGELAVKGSRWLRQAEELGDLYGAVWQAVYNSAVLLAANDPEAAQRQLKETVDKVWQRSRQFTLPQMTGILLQCEADLYSAKPEAALERLEQTMMAAEASFTAMPIMRVWANRIKGIASVELAQARPAEKEQLVSQAEACARALEQEQLRLAPASTSLVRAAIAHARGQRERALSELDAASLRFDEAEMFLHATCVRRRKGELLGGEAGWALIEAADTAMREQGIRDLQRWTGMFAAGLSPDRGS